MKAMKMNRESFRKFISTRLAHPDVVLLSRLPRKAWASGLRI
jgi:hypothetical protein